MDTAGPGEPQDPVLTSQAPRLAKGRRPHFSVPQLSPSKSGKQYFLPYKSIANKKICTWNDALHACQVYGTRQLSC